MGKNIKFYYLTDELHKLLLTIKATLDTTGYDDLVDHTIKTRKYHHKDQVWLMCVRRKWVNHLKAKQEKKRIYKIYLQDD
jgi:hypothetical protein